MAAPSDIKAFPFDLAHLPAIPSHPPSDAPARSPVRNRSVFFLRLEIVSACTLAPSARSCTNQLAQHGFRYCRIGPIPTCSITMKNQRAILSDSPTGNLADFYAFARFGEDALRLLD
jgi:hypothetical protein